VVAHHLQKWNRVYSEHPKASNDSDNRLVSLEYSKHADLVYVAPVALEAFYRDRASRYVWWNHAGSAYPILAKVASLIGKSGATDGTFSHDRVLAS